MKDPKYEIVCAKCGGAPKTHNWSQKQYNDHMWKVHQFRNEVHIGKDPRPDNLRLL